MRRLLGGVVGVAVAVLLPVLVARSNAAKLEVASLPGTWTGTWTNHTFGSSGGMNVVVTQLSDTMIDVQWSFTGSVFGCGSIAPTHHTMLKGKNCGDVACFTDHGISVKGTDAIFGDVTIKAKKAGKFAGHGKNTCGGVGPKSYHGNAKLVGQTMTGKLKIKTSSGVATTTFSVTRQ
jgi:hypothetical protein